MLNELMCGRLCSQLLTVMSPLMREACRKGVPKTVWEGTMEYMLRTPAQAAA